MSSPWVEDVPCGAWLVAGSGCDGEEGAGVRSGGICAGVDGSRELSFPHMRVLVVCLAVHSYFALRERQAANNVRTPGPHNNVSPSTLSAGHASPVGHMQGSPVATTPVLVTAPRAHKAASSGSKRGSARKKKRAKKKQTQGANACSSVRRGAKARRRVAFTVPTASPEAGQGDGEASALLLLDSNAPVATPTWAKATESSVAKRTHRKVYSPRQPAPKPRPVTSPPHVPNHVLPDGTATADDAPSGLARLTLGSRVRLGCAHAACVPGGTAGKRRGASSRYSVGHGSSACEQCATAYSCVDLSRDARHYGVNVLHTTSCNHAVHDASPEDAAALSYERDSTIVSLHTAEWDRSEAEALFNGDVDRDAGVLVGLQWLEYVHIVGVPVACAWC